MKKLLTIATAIFLFGSLFLLNINFSSCTKEVIHDIVHDTTIINHHDTTIVNHHDTTIVNQHDTIIVNYHDTIIVNHHDTTTIHDTSYIMILAPHNNPTESCVDSYFSTGTGVGVPHLIIGDWSAHGLPEKDRTYLKFDYSDLPPDIIIVSSKLSLYANPVPIAGNQVDAHFGSANAIFIQRTTSDWSPSTISWNNQPSSTAINQVSLPATTSNFQNDVNIDVSNLVRDMLVNGNFGFSIKLQNENNVYNIRQYASSYNTHTDKVPKLVINYKNK
jgi:hypothetical protein